MPIELILLTVLGDGMLFTRKVSELGSVLQAHLTIQKWRQGSSQHNNKKSLILNSLSGLVSESRVHELW